MRPLYVVYVAIGVALLSSAATLAVVRAEPAVARSTTFDWTKLEVKPIEAGSRREVMRSATPTLDQLEIHITTLNAGAVSHPPHRHSEEELLIVKEGMVETLQNGRPRSWGRDRSSFTRRTTCTTSGTSARRLQRITSCSGGSRRRSADHCWIGRWATTRTPLTSLSVTTTSVGCIRTPRTDEKLTNPPPPLDPDRMITDAPAR